MTFYSSLQSNKHFKVSIDQFETLSGNKFTTIMLDFSVASNVASELFPNRCHWNVAIQKLHIV